MALIFQVTEWVFLLRCLLKLCASGDLFGRGRKQPHFAFDLLRGSAGTEDFGLGLNIFVLDLEGLDFEDFHFSRPLLFHGGCGLIEIELITQFPTKIKLPVSF